MPEGSVLVTGATGFIGRRIQNRLLEDGWHVRVLARSSSPRIDNLDPRTELIDASLGDFPALSRAVAGTRAVINCAGSVRGLSASDFEPANVHGVKLLCEAITRLSSAPALLHISSLAASEPTLSDYANSKFEGERVVQCYRDLNWCVIRPPAVYGPGETEMRAALGWARRGIVPIAGGDRNQRISYIQVDDLVAAMVAWLDNPEAHRHQTYA
ncbi:MAG: NAD-dependent epimerase/dehydratase family protein, partial [Pseudomonadales bacterium]